MNVRGVTRISRSKFVVKVNLRPALLGAVIIGSLTSAIYPFAVHRAVPAIFPTQAAGSSVALEGATVGSTLLGQILNRVSLFRSPASRLSELYQGAAW
jgi:K+-transporting ATPase c subunit